MEFSSGTALAQSPCDSPWSAVMYSARSGTSTVPATAWSCATSRRHSSSTAAGGGGGGNVGGGAAATCSGAVDGGVAAAPAASGSSGAAPPGPPPGPGGGRPLGAGGLPEPCASDRLCSAPLPG